MSSELEAVVDLLKSQGKISFVKPATNTQIEVFEAKHQFQLPSQLKQWLLISDGGDFFLPAGFQLRGVSNLPLIDVNDPDRPDASYIVIGTLASGDPVLCEKSTEQISIYNHEAGRIEDDESFTDFFTYLTRLAAVVGIGDEYVE